MKKRVFIIHGWEGSPENAWFPWLREELAVRGFEVFVPQLPQPEEPRIQNWLPALKGVAPDPDEATYFVGHSLGCQTIARHLEGLPEHIIVGGAVFVGGFFKRLTNIEADALSQSVAKEWLSAPLNLSKVRTRLRKSVAIFSDNDDYVPLENQDDFRDKLGATIIVEKQMGHFDTSSGVTELPVALESLLQIAQ